jgi:hypothetical protein
VKGTEGARLTSAYASLGGHDAGLLGEQAVHAAAAAIAAATSSQGSGGRAAAGGCRRPSALPAFTRPACAPCGAAAPPAAPQPAAHAGAALLTGAPLAEPDAFLLSAVAAAAGGAHALQQGRPRPQHTSASHPGAAPAARRPRTCPAPPSCVQLAGCGWGGDCGTRVLLPGRAA